MDEERRSRVKARQERIADMLVRAAGDAGLRQELLSDPRMVFGPDGDQRPELPEQVDEIRRDIISHLVDRVAADPEFGTLMHESLFKAIRTAGLTPRMEQLRAELPVKAEVTGYIWGWPDWGDGWGDPDW